MLWFNWKIRRKVFLLNLAVIGVAVGIGLGVDYWLHSSPKALVIAVVASFPVTQYVIFKVIKKDLELDSSKKVEGVK